MTSDVTESAAAKPKEKRPPVDPSQPLRSEREEAYCQERAFGYGMIESARRLGWNTKNGGASKYEDKPRCQARMAFLRRRDLTDEMMKAKRLQLQERLELAAFFNIFDFTTVDGEKIKIDWERLSQSGYGAVVSEFRFDKETGALVVFKRDDAEGAAAQLRDMHGFKTLNRLSAEAKLEQATEAEQAKEGQAVVTRFTLSIFDDRDAASA